jgi:hypothetical protein
LNLFSWSVDRLTGLSLAAAGAASISLNNNDDHHPKEADQTYQQSPCDERHGFSPWWGFSLTGLMKGYRGQHQKGIKTKTEVVKAA